MITKRMLPFVLICSLIAVACDTRGLSYGDPNSIIAVLSPDRWDEVSEDIYSALETTIVTVRDEKMFTVTYQEPYGDNWLELRRFRQMLVVGTASEPWVQEVVERSDEPITDPGVHQVSDVWSRGQTVTLVLLAENDGPGAIAGYLPAVHERLNAQYLAYARTRMYFSGVDSALADTLATEAGFSVLLPKVYRWHRVDSTYVFRNDNPDPSELIRQVAVTWRSPAHASLEVDDALAWRADVVAQHYTEPQEAVLAGMSVESLDFRNHDAIEVRAQWRNPPELGWPAGGPFVTRALTCDSQDRTYLIDSWLYAPGKEKYEYMIQLETILDTFRCE